MRRRRTARVLVFDPAGRVLLIRFAVARAEGEFVFWLTPGGEIEPGETELDAAERELREELGIAVEVTGPVWEEANQFMHQGEMRDNVDFFFTARCAEETPSLQGITPEEIAVMREIRWWSAEEIEASTERFFPADLASRVRLGPAPWS
jgi:8-oxo-dGTP pyrophosphatase MutT (NUDIX family)